MFLNTFSGGVQRRSVFCPAQECFRGPIVFLFVAVLMFPEDLDRCSEIRPGRFCKPGAHRGQPGKALRQFSRLCATFVKRLDTLLFQWIIPSITAFISVSQRNKTQQQNKETEAKGGLQETRRENNKTGSCWTSWRTALFRSRKSAEPN